MIKVAHFLDHIFDIGRPDADAVADKYWRSSKAWHEFVIDLPPAVIEENIIALAEFIEMVQ